MNYAVGKKWYFLIYLWNTVEISIEIIEKENMPSMEAWKTWQKVGVGVMFSTMKCEN